MSVVRSAVVLVLLIGCGGLGEDPVGPGGAPPDAPVTSSPIDPGSPIPSPSPEIVRPQAGLLDVRPQPWDTAEPLNPRTLLVSFYSGVHECYGVDRVDVDSGTRAVTVTLYIGRVRGAQVCVEIAQYQAVRVSLDEPLRDREIIDGAS